MAACFRLLTCGCLDAVVCMCSVFSGKEEDADFLLLEAKPLARGMHCDLHDGDAVSGWITRRYEQFLKMTCG
jgi:hypothetical protein